MRKQAMNVLARLALVGAIAGVVLAQTATRNGSPFLQFKSINMKLLGGGKVRVLVQGSPMKAHFTEQKLSVTAKSFTGFGRSAPQKQFALDTATITGSVFVAMERPSAAKAGGTQTIEVTTEQVDFVDADHTLTANSKIHIDRKDPSAGQSLVADASSGVVTLYDAKSAGRFGFKAMRLAGPVTARFVKTQSAQGKVEKTDVRVRADRLEYDDAKGLMTLTGHVHIEGDHPLLFGDLDATKAVVTFDSSGEIEEIEMSGEPATTNVVRKPPGGR